MQQLLKMEVKDAHTLDPMLYAEQHGIDWDTDFEDEEYLQAAFAPTLDAPLEDVAGTIVDPVPPIKKRSSATRWILLFVGFVALGLLGGYWIQTQRQTTNTHITPQPIRPLQPTYAPQKGRPNGTTKLAPSPQRTHAPVHRGRTHRE
jgi:hypothetical protein